MKSYFNPTLMIALSFYAMASSSAQNISDVAFHLGGGPVIHTDLGPDYEYTAYSLGGSLQFNFVRKRGFSLGIQAGVQRVIEKYQITEFGWDVQYQPYAGHPDPLSYSQPNVWVTKHHLWQLFLISNYHFQNNIILEGSLGTNLIIEDDNLNVKAVPLIGLGGGYLFKITHSLYIPLKLTTYLEFTPRIDNGGLKINGGSLFPGVYSGILFNVNTK